MCLRECLNWLKYLSMVLRNYTIIKSQWISGVRSPSLLINWESLRADLLSSYHSRLPVLIPIYSFPCCSFEFHLMSQDKLKFFCQLFFDINRGVFDELYRVRLSNLLNLENFNLLSSFNSIFHFSYFLVN